MKTKVAKTAVLLVVLVALYSFNVPKGWYKAGSAPEMYEIGIEKGAGIDGSNAATIRSEGLHVMGFGALVQNIKPGSYAGKRIRMCGYIKTEEVMGWGGFWMRIDGQKTCIPLAFDNMSNRKIKGSTNWVKCEIVVNVPKNATNIAYGALLSGGGQLWFDNLTFEIVDNLVATTIPYPKEKDAQNEPTNLAFEY
ncbi:MAG: hypothetical protein H7296_05205 [Bacteroidia bacterium]|nr:hypothetical protein [Bacteroidia bacterium]